MYGNIHNIIEKRKPAFVFAGMVLLVILSSCTVRRFISYELELPFIKLLNPSRATVHAGSHCSLDRAQTYFFTSSKASVDTSLHSCQVKEVDCSPIVLNVGYSLLSPSQGWPLSVKIPVYILFKKMKYWV